MTIQYIEGTNLAYYNGKRFRREKINIISAQKMDIHYTCTDMCTRMKSEKYQKDMIFIT